MNFPDGLLEVDSSVINVPYVRKAIIGTDDRPVRKVLGQDRFIRALNLGKRYDWFAYAYQRLNLLGYILVFSVSASEFNRAMSGEPTVDEVLQKRAETLGIPVTYMEAFDELLARILEEGEEEQLNFLSALLDCNEYIETMEILQRDAYRHQDLAEILYLATSGWHDAEEECVQALGDSEILTELERVILRISTILADGGAFIALSARILPGERGLLSRLAEQGYQIRRVY